jgi:transposase
MTAQCVAGIDVSKARLDVHVLPQRVALAFSNDEAGIATLTRELQSLGVERVVVEATGGLEYRAARALADAALSVERVQPGRIRAFRTVLGKRAKSDPLDAKLAARFALAMPEEHAGSVPSQEAEAIRSLSARRRQLVDLLVQEKTRLKMTRDPIAVESLKITIAQLKKERARIEALLESAFEKDTVIARKNTLLRTIPGIGPVVKVHR